MKYIKLLYIGLISLISIVFVSCLSKDTEQEKDCECCSVKRSNYPLDASRSKVLSQFKESDDYDIISEVAVKIIKSEFPIATGMTIWDNDYSLTMYYSDKPNCPAATFGVKQIIYFNYGDLIVGYKVAKKTYENQYDNKLDYGFDSSSFFIKYQNSRDDVNSRFYEMYIDRSDTLIKGRKYGDFTYVGPMHLSVPSNIGTLLPKYQYAFVVETSDTAAGSARYIYIDKEYGLIRYVLNDGSLWTLIH